ncbi:VapE domain-containing protein [Synechococcus sp. CBW1107]|uniref:VapE domain-containing protein n=1 Tax=Synechococcus sp. CBW1107 TaxID=2789857 RepID=UPI002AD49FD2|nr:VapE domain-containing protein [Synechococcus sp. CBW1107]
MILQGYALCPSLLAKGIRDLDHSYGGQYVFIDVDNFDPKRGGPVHDLTLEAAKLRFADEAVLIYTTSSHRQPLTTDKLNGIRKAGQEPNSDHHSDRFRIVFLLDRPVPYAAGFDDIIEALVHRVGVAADPTAGAVQYMASNPDAEVILLDPSNRISSDALRMEHTALLEDREGRHAERMARFGANTDETNRQIALACLKYGPTRDVTGTNPECFKMLAALVHTFGPETATELAYTTGWAESWNAKEQPVEERARQIFESSHSGAKPGIGTLIHLTDTWLQGHPEKRQAWLQVMPKDPVEEIARRIQQALDESPNANRYEMVLTIARHHAGHRLAKNALTGEYMLDGKPLEQRHVNHARTFLRDHVLGYMLGRQEGEEMLDLLCSEREINPVAEYLESVGQSNRPGISAAEVAKTALCNDDPMQARMLEVWLAAAVGRAFQPGLHFPHVLLLLSSIHGNLKSGFFQILAGEELYSDGFAIAGQDRDVLDNCHQHWVIEIGELDQYAARKRDLEALKQLVSASTDCYRSAHGRGGHQERRKRKFVLGATSNNLELFKAGDENRRFMPVEQRGIIDDAEKRAEWLLRNRDGIWAEACRRWQELGPKATRLSPAEVDAVKAATNQYRATFARAEELARKLEKLDVQAITPEEVMVSLLGMNLQGGLALAAKREIAEVMTAEGYIQKRNVAHRGRKVSRVWRREDRSTVFDPEGNALF